MGYGHIAAAHAGAIAVFYRQQMNPYLNFHRPCGVPERKADGKGKLRRIYRRYATPFALVCELDEVSFRPEVTLESLTRRANASSDTQAATAMQRAKRQLFASFQPRRTA